MLARAVPTTGIGLRSQHVSELLATKANVGFLEAHSENYFGGGLAREQLKELASHYPISLHGVGLSLGRADDLDTAHLQQLCSLVQDINPFLVSEHLSWSAYSHTHVPDLLPIPFINEALDVFADHVNELQDKLGRQVLIENPSNYIAFAELDFTEPEFLNALVEKTQCGLLLDINNIAVSAYNLGYNCNAYIDAIENDGRVKHMHLAGYQVKELDSGDRLYLDTHGNPVYPEVWTLYQKAVDRFGALATLIEWDTDIPELAVLIEEAHKADKLIAEARQTTP